MLYTGRSQYKLYIIATTTKIFNDLGSNRLSVKCLFKEDNVSQLVTRYTTLNLLCINRNGIFVFSQRISIASVNSNGTVCFIQFHQ